MKKATYIWLDGKQRELTTLSVREIGKIRKRWMRDRTSYVPPKKLFNCEF